MQYNDNILDSGLGQINLGQESVKKINFAKIEINNEIDHIKKGRNALFVMVGLVIIGVLAGLFMNPYQATSMEIIVEGIIFGSIYLACGLFVKKNPLASFVTALSFYVLYQVLVAFVDPSFLAKGIIIKVMVFYFLGKGISAATKVRKWKIELKRMGIPDIELQMIENLEVVPRTIFVKGGE